MTMMHLPAKVLTCAENARTASSEYAPALRYSGSSTKKRWRPSSQLAL